MTTIRFCLLMLCVQMLTFCSSASEQNSNRIGLGRKQSRRDEKDQGNGKKKKGVVTSDAETTTGSAKDDPAAERPPSDQPPAPAPSPGPGGSASSTLALHTPQPAACGGCHERKRPSATHYPGKDCALCHKYPSFATGTFLHNPKPTECESCHARPTQAGQRAYPNQGPPAGFNAADPKAIGGGHYVGKDCVQCHETPTANGARFVFSHSSPNPQACLPCHFNQGFAQHGNRQYFTGFGSCTNCHSNFSVQTGRNFGRN